MVNEFKNKSIIYYGSGTSLWTLWQCSSIPYNPSLSSFMLTRFILRKYELGFNLEFWQENIFRYVFVLLYYVKHESYQTETVKSLFFLTLTDKVCVYRPVFAALRQSSRRDLNIKAASFQRCPPHTVLVFSATRLKEQEAHSAVGRGRLLKNQQLSVLQEREISKITQRLCQKQKVQLHLELQKNSLL